MSTYGERIRGVLREHGKLARDPDELEAGADLYQAGLTSYTSVSVMLALEDALNVEFPDAMLNRALFSTIANIEQAVTQLRPHEASSNISA